MAPRRRSSRITGPSTPAQNHAVPVTSKLSSLVERDESPPAAQPTIDTLISSPIAPNTAPNPARFDSLTSTMTTPQHGSRILPPRSEMHPSKAQSSTMKPSQIAKPVGIHPSNDLPRSPSKIAMATPSTRPSTAPRRSSTFDFSFEKPESDLSSEARKIMDSVREEAAKIKAQMMAEQKRQQTSDEEAKQLFGVGGRQLKKAKGRSGRFSDLHRQEFKKMDSIANHASTWKNKLQGTSETSLKRSSSKAALDQQAPSNLPHSKSSGTLKQTANDRLENSSPSKRARRDLDQDTSAARPGSRDDTTTTKVPLNGLPSAVSTPTKSSLARSASVKSLKTSMIPSLTRSQSTRTLAGPTAPQTEPSNKRLGSWAKLGGNMKSILHRAQPKFSNDPVKVSAGTHLPATQAQASVDKDLPSLPDTPTMKRVDFSNSTKSRHELPASPSKSPTSKSMQSLPRPQSSSSQAAPSALERNSERIHYPDLTASPLITTTRGKSSKASTPAPAPASATPTPLAGPGDFTFRADTSVSFKETPAAAKHDNSNPASFTSPNGTRTIRPVRPSGVPTYMMPGAYDSTPFIAAPAITHGLSNKKRKHADPDTESEAENIDPQGMDLDKANSGDEDDGRAKKKVRTGSEAPERMMSGNPQKKGRMITKTGSPAKRRMTGTGATTPKKGGLSLARLNMLARPKERR